MIGIAIFLVVLIAFFYTLLSRSSTTSTELLLENERVQEAVVSSASLDPLTGVIGGVVDDEKIRNLTTQNYDDLKRQLGLRHDFYLHFEDENGRTLVIDDQHVGIGSNRVIIVTTSYG